MKPQQFIDIAKPRAAPHVWPYPHRTLAEIAARTPHHQQTPGREKNEVRHGHGEGNI